jgi:hypothetical protein
VNKRPILVAALVCAVAASSLAADKFPEPTGFGTAKFGMSVDEVRTLYPTLHPSKVTLQAAEKGKQLIVLYELENQSIGPLHACQVDLRFFKNELFEVQFHCPERDKAVQYVHKTYGTATKTTPNAVFWTGQQATVSLAPQSGAFGFTDMKRAQTIQAALLAAFSKRRVGQTPTAAVPETTTTPAEAPAAPPTQ